MKFAVGTFAVAVMFAARASAFASRPLFGLSTSSRHATLPSTQHFSSSMTVLQMGASPLDFVKSEIASNEVVVFSKTSCPYCSATKSLFQELQVNAKVIELDVVEDGDRIQSALLDLTGQRTVPNVFIKGNHLGGNDKTQEAARSGKLQTLLKAEK